MQNLTEEFIRKNLKEKEIRLTTTHKRLCIPIINRIYKKMAHGIKFDSIRVCENLIIDGHHRYVSSILAGIGLDTVKSSKTSATIEYGWMEVDFVEEEWDTQDKINRLNEIDAEFNNLPIEKIIEITK
jgi:hypothetical protein